MHGILGKRGRHERALASWIDYRKCILVAVMVAAVDAVVAVPQESSPERPRIHW
jgi:hypothetical protein